MAIHLYQSKKAHRYIGESVYMDEPWDQSQVDPLTVWYVDVFFIKRERYLVFANPLTKLSCFIFRYSKKSHPDFFESFKQSLTITLLAADVNPQVYLQGFDVLVPFTSTNKSASSHISRLKQEYQWMLEDVNHSISPPDDERHYNQIIARDICSYGGKDYDYPSKRFYHELLLRRWTS
ncbi:DUF6933 domain-containing protein [Marinoscillum pacificum]|uniref:DUF6933 domain-containing protein n=1 Tax=Marinoscillum pacificum TaxID=392723 RepID=UPI00215855A6|nr:hypothetical protein [Marinoscillum pacificum]